MSELNFVFGISFIASVVMAFYLGENPQMRAGNLDVAAAPASGVSVPGAVSAQATGKLDRQRLRTNKTALDILKTFEGLSLNAYPQADTWLIGYGHKGAGVHSDMSISALTAERYLREDLLTCEEFVASVVKTPVNRNEFSALVALTYNIGNSAFRNSTVLRLLNEGDRSGAADAFLMWNKVVRDGDLAVSNTLAKRRKAERALFRK